MGEIALNAKKSKQLRRLAQRTTEGSFAKSKILSERGDCIVNNPKAPRGMYRLLKRAAS